MSDYTDQLRAVASTRLTHHLATTPGDDALLVQVALAALYQRRGLEDLAAKALFDLINSLPPNSPQFTDKNPHPPFGL